MLSDIGYLILEALKKAKHPLTCYEIEKHCKAEYSSRQISAYINTNMEYKLVDSHYPKKCYSKSKRRGKQGYRDTVKTYSITPTGLYYVERDEEVRQRRYEAAMRALEGEILE